MRLGAPAHPRRVRERAAAGWPLLGTVRRRATDPTPGHPGRGTGPSRSCREHYGPVEGHTTPRDRDPQSPTMRRVRCPRVRAVPRVRDCSFSRRQRAVRAGAVSWRGQCLGAHTTQYVVRAPTCYQELRAENSRAHRRCQHLATRQHAPPADSAQRSVCEARPKRIRSATPRLCPRADCSRATPKAVASQTSRTLLSP